MSVEQNKATLRRIVEEVFNKGDMSVVPELISPEYSYHNPMGMEFKGPDGFVQFVQMERNVFPDIHVTIDDMIGEGDKLAARLSFTGTFKGKFGDFEPTGNKVSHTAAYFYRYADGKEVEALPFTDMLPMYQQMGISPPTG